MRSSAFRAGPRISGWAIWPSASPDLGFSTSWVQEGTNQRVLLDTFFSAARPDQSLVFFYAKRTPMVEDARRVIIGVGRVKTIGAAIPYRNVGGTWPNSRISGYLWERNIEHSIRPDGTDGFLLPYRELVALAEDDASLDLGACTAFAPDEYFDQYSYGSELLSQDGAIGSLLALEKAIKSMRSLLEAPWAEYLRWIDRELNRPMAGTRRLPRPRCDPACLRSATWESVSVAPSGRQRESH